MSQFCVGYRSGRLTKHGYTKAMHLHGDRRGFAERMEIDDAYLGGDRYGGTAGCVLPNKVLFIAKAQTKPMGQSVLACVCK